MSYPYDKLFHLRLQIVTSNAFKFTIEKNEVIKVSNHRRDKDDEVVYAAKRFLTPINTFLGNA